MGLGLSIKYRIMEVEDLPTVVSFMQEYGERGSGFRYNPERDSEEKRANFLGKNCGLSLVAIDEVKKSKDIVGMIFVSGDGGSTGYLQRLFVLPDYRGNGIGTGITSYAIEKLNSLGCHHITAHVPKKNKAAQRVFEKLGAQKVSDFDILDIKG